MQNWINRQMDITWNLMHELAVETHTTLREINAIVKDRIYDIVWEVLRKTENKNQWELFDK